MAVRLVTVGLGVMEGPEEMAALVVPGKMEVPAKPEEMGVMEEPAEMAVLAA